jgi:tetratricopeptide repeat protein 8
MKAGRQGTASARPMTSGGRQLRLGTASLANAGDDENFIVAERLNALNTAKKKHMAKAVTDYLIYVEGNFRRALDVASEALVIAKYEDWWWKARIGKCYMKMGMINDAEKQLVSSLK